MSLKKSDDFVTGCPRCGYSHFGNCPPDDDSVSCADCGQVGHHAAPCRARPRDRFHELLGEIAALHDQKREDYGRPGDSFSNVRAAGEWGVEPWVGAMIRLTDKVRRLQTFRQKGVLANEPAFDSLKDIAVYALIAYCLLEETVTTHITAIKKEEA